MRVAILGMGPSAEGYMRHAAGTGDVRKVFDEVWTVNAFGSIFAADRVFHMDDIRVQQIRAEAGNEQVKNLIDYLQRAKGPIYTSRALPKEPNLVLEQCEQALARIPDGHDDLIGDGEVNDRAALEGCVRWMRAERTLQERGGFDGLLNYPLAQVLSATGGPPYFTSTVPYAIAMALAGKKAGLPEDVTRLSVFGVDYSHINVIKAEVGRACCEFWLGRCVEKGIELGLPQDTWLLGTSTKSRLYGYDTQLVSMHWNGEDECIIEMKNKPAPTAAEIERAYDHTQPQGNCAA